MPNEAERQYTLAQAHKRKEERTALPFIGSVCAATASPPRWLDTLVEIVDSVQNDRSRALEAYDGPLGRLDIDIKLLVLGQVGVSPNPPKDVLGDSP